MVKFLENHWIIYGMLGICGLEILLRLILSGMYTRLIRTSNKIGSTKNKLMKRFYEAGQKALKGEIHIQNVDIYVDKCLFNHKCGGFRLSTWERLCRKLTALCFLTGSAGVVLGLYYEVGPNYMLSTLVTLFVSGELLIIMEILSKLPLQKEMLYVNMRDYMENALGVTRIQEPEPVKEPVLSLKERAKRRESDLEAGQALAERTAMNPREQQVVKEVLQEFMTEAT
ncbi:hypothetical protein [Anaerolentibacter hominis]|uniref:hypothetical protein n=1 Tax=Anaerolentibacter hominis TaxID=3079009 RepID=UPI0031B8A94D